MKNLKTVAIVAIAVLILYNCRKAKDEIIKDLKTASTKENSIRNFNSSLKKIPTRIYKNITDHQARTVVDKFKTQVELRSNTNFQSRLIVADSIQLDSTVWVLEAALNYDFDYIQLKGDLKPLGRTLWC